MKLGIVIGSIREGRMSLRMAKWVEQTANSLEGVTSETFDLMEHQLPMFDEAISPQFNQDRKPSGEVKAWLDFANSCDAIALVTPEYNRSYSSVLKNALDYLAYELRGKPVMLAAHGSTGGAQAVAHLRGVLPGLKAVTSPTAVMVVGPLTNLFDEDGKPTEAVSSNPRGPQQQLDTALEELKWHSDALAIARANQS